MAQYKVLQDIEAEDKLLGPLSLRQFIYAAITLALGFIAFRLFVSPVWFLGIIFLPPALFFALLSAPIGGQQSSEIWLLAKIRFFIVPRKRIWDQTGLKELVTITVPKKIEKHLTKGYSDDEVKSRLKTLATTLDTRGWAVKNASAPVYGAPSDRLLDIGETSSQRVTTDVTTDIMDPEASPRAQAVDALMNKTAEQYKTKVRDNLQKYAQPTAQMPQPANEQAILDQLHIRKAATQNLHPHTKVIPAPSSPLPTPQKQGQSAVTPPADPAILNIVENSEGLSVQTIAGQAERAKKNDGDEVVISLH